MKNEIMEILSQYEGIIGALLGFTLAEGLKRLGKIKLYTKSISRTYEVHDDYGCYYYVSKEDGAYTEHNDKIGDSNVDISIDIANTYQENKMLRDISIKVIFENGEIKYYTPNDKSTRKPYGGSYTYDKLTILNLPPKTINIYEMYISIPNELTECEMKRVYFIATKTNHTKFKKKLL